MGTGGEREIETTKEIENNWWSKVTEEAVGEKSQNKDEELNPKQKVEWDGGGGSSEVQEHWRKSDMVTIKIHWRQQQWNTKKHWAHLDSETKSWDYVIFFSQQHSQIILRTQKMGSGLNLSWIEFFQVVLNQDKEVKELKKLACSPPKKRVACV